MADTAAAVKPGSDFVAQLEASEPASAVGSLSHADAGQASGPRPAAAVAVEGHRTVHRTAVSEVAIDDVERRALILVNPAFGGETVTTSNLIAAFTVLDPGDRARPHRHTFAAIRFATRAEGAATIVNGRRCDMHEGDLILTPPMCWHGHINDSDRRIIWFDAANIRSFASSMPISSSPATPRPTSSGRSTKATRSCGPSPAWPAPTCSTPGAFAEVSLFRRGTGGCCRRCRRVRTARTRCAIPIQPPAGR